jgi:hypothetical protein
MIGKKFNYQDVFLRDLTICLLDTLEGRIQWTNRFTKGDVDVKVPIYYSLTGSEDFLLDSFQDDVVSNNRFVDLNTDQIPRGHVTLTNWTIRSDEFRNPNVWLKDVVEEGLEVKRMLRKVRAIPITATFELTVLLKTEIDVFKCSQSIMDSMWLYKFMFFEYNYMHIDAFMEMPDNNSIEISREKSLKGDNEIKLNATIEVQTYYPSFDEENDTREVKPFRTRWFNNLKMLRDGKPIPKNPNSGDI